MEVFRFFRISFLVMFLISLIIGTATAETWEKTFGGRDSDGGLSVQQTTDGGYIIAGSTYSFGKRGSEDVYLIKTDANGKELWSKTYGGSDDEMARCVQQTTDGGYIIAGEVLYETAGEDFYLVKTDASGKELWSKTFGLRTTDRAYSVQETNDGDYIIVGESFTFVGGNDDVWLIKTDADGKELWSKTYGGANYDGGRSVQQTTDGGYIIVGDTGSFGAGGSNVYLIKTDGNGNELWHKAFGAGGHEGADAVQQTTDGGYIIVGSTSSFGAGSYDVWLIKTDVNGNELWNKTFGGSTYDYGQSVQQTADGGYIICGFTGSFGAGNTDVWLIKTDDSGNQIWSKTFGGSDFDWGYSVQQTSDNGYIIAGDTQSFGAGSSDVYLVYVLPGADFVASPTMGPAPLSVNFTDQSTGEITSWLWDFGDGLTSTEQNPIHIYSNPGTYTVSLAVTDPEGSDTEIKHDYISVFDIEPVQGTIGTEVDITNVSLGEKKPKVLIGETECKVLTFTTISVSCLIKKVKSAMGPGTYDVTIIQKGKGVEPIDLPNAFSIMAPDIQDVTTIGTSATITGLFFGTKKVKAYLAVDGNGKRQKLKVTSLEMDPVTGVSQLEVTVSNKVLKKLGPGLYDVIVTNQFGSDSFTNGLTIK